MRTLANFSIALHFIIVKLLIIVLATDVNCKLCKKQPCSDEQGYL